MKPTRILLADSGGVRGLSHVVRNLSTGPCTVRSAAPTESLSSWHPDLVLMDPGPREERTRTSARSEEPGREVRHVVVLTLCYEGETATTTGRASEGALGGLTSATAQLIDLTGRDDGADERVVPAPVGEAGPDQPSCQLEIQFDNPAGAAASPRWLMWEPAPVRRVPVGLRFPGEVWRLRLARDKNPSMKAKEP